MRHTKLAMSCITLIILTLPLNAQVTPEQDVIMSVDRIWDRAGHNAFTGMVAFNNRLYCSFREGSDHVYGINGSIRIIASDDGQNWYSVAHLFRESVDLRDPKLSVTPDNRIMVNLGGSVYEGKKLIRMEPLVSFSDQSGRNFSDPQEINIEKSIRTERDWLWRATWHKGIAYAAVYQALEDESRLQLVKSHDGINYNSVTSFDLTGRPNETTLRFTDQDQMIAVVRRESGSNFGFIGISKQPYTEWNWKELEARLGGPDLLVLPEGHLIVGTREYPPDFNNKMIIAKVTTDGTFRKLVSLPSGGDCSYPAMVVKDNILYVSYYSSHEERTSIYLARVWLDRLKTWLLKEESRKPEILSDKDGVIELKVPEGGQVRYTMDGTEPTEASGLIYNAPIQVQRTVPLKFRSFEAGRLASPVVTALVGKDVLQKARKVKHTLEKGIRFTYYEGEVRKVKDITSLNPVESGIQPDIRIDQGLREENFAFRFEGYLKVPASGLYHFYLISNDGSQLKLNDELVIDNDSPHGEREVSTIVSLQQGYHKIELKYFQLGGGKLLKLLWQGPGFKKQEIHSEFIHH